MSRPAITALVQTYNASEFLDEVLASLHGFDEILVVDMESTDDTLDIARRHGARIIVKERGKHRIVEAYRDFSIQAAANDWVFVVDADEIVPKALVDYLYGELERDPSPRGIMVSRKNYFMGRWMRSDYPDYTIRLLPKRGTNWPYIIHVMPTHDGPTVKIPRSRTDLAIIHLADQDMHARLAKFNSRTTSELDRRTQGYSKAKFFYEPFFRFFRTYVLKGGFRDGLPGLVKCIYDGIYRFDILAKIQNNINAARTDTDIIRDRAGIRNKE